ncbi:hypothetical protein [Marinomonas sp.]|uniref:hypothetical protein n=1 Tax=Marinomonas sp. TaxID=1904862 RepID=UPI003BAA4DAD
MDFKEKVIAFIDIIGFKNIVENSEKGEGKSLSEILEILNIFNTPRNTVCALSDDDLDFVITQISDCAVISAELSDLGIVNLIEHCHSVTSGLMLDHGIMCRGYITIGNIYHTPTQVVGTGYQKAYLGEGKVIIFQQCDEKTPFVEIGPEVQKRLDDIHDPCIKSYIKLNTHSDDVYQAINPFSCLTRLADSSEHTKQLHRVKGIISGLKLKISTISPDEDKNAFAKSKYYYSFLNEQNQKCDELISREETLSQPFPSRKMDEIYNPK